APEAPEPPTPAPAEATPPGAEPDTSTNGEPAGEPSSPESLETTLSRLPLEEIRRYVAVFNAVRSAYVEPVSDHELMQAAIRGLLWDLDPHSVYMERDDAEAFAEGASGAYGGVGLEIVPLPEGGMRVVAPFDGTPAERAGLRPGDVITAIDGKPVLAGDDSRNPLRGEPGTTVSVTVLREQAPAPLELQMVREVIRITSVRSRMLEPGYGYVRLSQFQADTAADFNKAVSSLDSGQGQRLRGLVIDLRSNPGGLLTSAVQIADDLLESGTIVTTRGRLPISDARFTATPGDVLDGAPVVVLVDAGSASASEVLAGALRDNGRARVVGSRSFGKGSVQTVLPLDNGDSVKLTTARYYTPRGTSIQARGIEPDVLLKAQADSTTRLPRVSEASLPGHLEADDASDADGSDGEALPGQGPIDAALAELKRMAAGN
ncbi:MAG: S41 family peptidase, partial [Pseudoxanthomonas suwonensis]|nr:S41 family peptidase [Pseudoxanthomonas suwonensis]